MILLVYEIGEDKELCTKSNGLQLGSSLLTLPSCRPNGQLDVFQLKLITPSDYNYLIWFVHVQITSSSQIKSDSYDGQR